MSLQILFVAVIVHAEHSENDDAKLHEGCQKENRYYHVSSFILTLKTIKFVSAARIPSDALELQFIFIIIYYWMFSKLIFNQVLLYLTNCILALYYIFQCVLVAHN